MNSIKYIGMDLHSATISTAVVNEAGKLNMEATIATEAAAVLDFIAGVQGTLHVTFEEGIHAAWLYELLLPHVAEVVVCDPRQLPRHRGENKNDKIDAQQLAQWLRLGVLKPVYHRPTGLRTLRELVRSYRCARRPRRPCSPRAENTRRRRFCSAFRPWGRCAWRF